MEIKVIRIHSSQWGIDGHLYINRQRICDTVEHPERHLPAGDYTISSLSGPALGVGYDLPQPFRHGDGALALKHGEIIVGSYVIPGLVTKSLDTYQRLYERLKKTFQRGNTVRLSIYG